MVNSSDFENKRNIKGNIMLKYNSSRNDVAITIDVLFPTLSPSFQMNMVANAVPPTADGVIAELNSHSIIIRRHFIHDNFFDDNIRNLIIYPKSRKNIIRNAISIKMTDKNEKCNREKSILSKSLTRNHKTIPNPNTVGSIILESFSLLIVLFPVSDIVTK